MSGQHTPGRLVSMAVAANDFGFTGPYLLASDRPAALGKIVVLAGGLTEPNARRLAACWNAFDGVDTIAINGANIASDWQHIRHQREQLERAEANLRYFKNALYYPGVPPFKVDGGDAVPTIVPQRVAEILEQRDAARTELAAARALLREVLKSDDEAMAELKAIGLGPCGNAAPDPKSMTERVRSYLDACDTLGGGA